MSEQPEALRLADALMEEHPFPRDIRLAAAELRRLHAENEALRRERDEARRTVREVHEAGTRLTAQRDALLEALQWIDKRCPRSIMKHPPHLIHQEMAHDAGVRARAAIKAVEEGQ